MNKNIIIKMNLRFTNIKENILKKMLRVKRAQEGVSL